MGGFDNISKRSHGLAAIFLATCLSTTSARAETPVAVDSDSEPHHAVSTSPSPPASPAQQNAGAHPTPAISAPDLPPLTRAATKQRIEEMSPVRWLAHYGHVSIGQRE